MTGKMRTYANSRGGGRQPGGNGPISIVTKLTLGEIGSGKESRGRCNQQRQSTAGNKDNR